LNEAESLTKLNDNIEHLGRINISKGALYRDFDKDYEKANKYFSSLIDSLGVQTDKLKARMYVADGYYERYMFDKALENYEKSLEYNPDTLQYYKIMFRMTECDYFLANIMGGLEKLEKLADDEVYYDSLSSIRLKMAEGYEWDGDFDAAINIYDKIIEEHAGEEAAAVAYYNLGLIYQYDFEDLKQAREYYQKARDEKRNSSVYNDATRRASKLAELERFIKSEEAGRKAESKGELDKNMRDQLTENQFKLGELFYFDLEKPDSAYEAFEILTERYADSRYAPRAYMSMAFIQRTDFSDTAAADSLLRVILKEYPHYDEAAQVISKLGLAGTAADTGYAEIKFRKAESFLEKFMELDSTMYYLRLMADSQVAADTLPEADSLTADSLAGDSAAMSDSMQFVDDMEIEDIDLGGAEGDAQADTIPEPEPAMDEATQRANDSARVADSIRYTEARRKADSIQNAFLQKQADQKRKDDSARVADSIKAMELMQMADSLGGRDSLAETPNDTTPLIRPNLAGISDTEAEDSTAGQTPTVDRIPPGVESRNLLDSLRSSATAALPDTTPPDLEKTPAVTGPIDSLPLPDWEEISSAAALPDTSLANYYSTLAEVAGQDDSAAVLDTVVSTATAALPDSVLISTPAETSDISVTADTETGADTGTAADSLAEADTVEVIDIFGDYWEPAFDSAQDSYDPELYRLLDSAYHYYRWVIDSFPFSTYNPQSHYVLLWMYDEYLDPGDSSIYIMYKNFVDSFPETEYAQAISNEYNIRTSKVAPARQLDDFMDDEEQEEAVDSSQFASYDVPVDTGMGGPGASPESQFITGPDGNQLPFANEYFLRENVAFEYPWEAIALRIEDKLYFHIRIDFSGEVAEVILKNPTESSELNERIIETVKNSIFDASRIDPELYDHWFYYTRTVTIPRDRRQ